MSYASNIPFIGGGKKKQNPVMVILLIAVIAIGVTGVIGAFNLYVVPKMPSSVGAVFVESPEQQAKEAKLAGISAQDIKSCNGVQSVNYNYNDRNFYLQGTDPATNVTLYDPFAKVVADDASSQTVPILSTIKGLAGNTNGVPSTTYFAEEVEIKSECADVIGDSAQPKLKQAAAPTMTVVGDDATTKLTSTTKETVEADTTYTATLKAKAPSNKCAARYGAYVACEYDSTYVSKVESSDLESSDRGIKNIAHTTFNNSFVADDWQVFKFDGELCDGDDTEFDIDYTTTSTTISDDGQADVNCLWLPLNKDLDADTFEMITDIYDEDNNIIFLGNTSARVYTNN